MDEIHTYMTKTSVKLKLSTFFKFLFFMTRTFSFAFKTLVVHIFCVCSGSYLCMYGNVHMYIDEKLLLLNELVTLFVHFLRPPFGFVILFLLSFSLIFLCFVYSIKEKILLLMAEPLRPNPPPPLDLNGR